MSKERSAEHKRGRMASLAVAIGGFLTSAYVAATQAAAMAPNKVPTTPLLVEGWPQYDAPAKEMIAGDVAHSWISQGEHATYVTLGVASMAAIGFGVFAKVKEYRQAQAYQRAQAQEQERADKQDQLVADYTTRAAEIEASMPKAVTDLTPKDVYDMLRSSQAIPQGDGMYRAHNYASEQPYTSQFNSHTETIQPSGTVAGHIEPDFRDERGNYYLYDAPTASHPIVVPA